MAKIDRFVDIKAKVKSIRDAGLLDSGYAKTIAGNINARLKEGEKTVTDGRVRRVAGGYEYDERVVDEILKMAKGNKVASQMKEADDILS